MAFAAWGMVIWLLAGMMVVVFLNVAKWIVRRVATPPLAQVGSVAPVASVTQTGSASQPADTVAA